MANISEQEQWEEGIYQLETSDPVGGGEDGVDNKPHKHLANRTKWLKKQVENLEIEDSKLDERVTSTEEDISNKISSSTSFCIQNPKSVSLINTKKTIGFMQYIYKGQTTTDNDANDYTFDPLVDILPWKHTYWNNTQNDIEITYYTDDTQTSTDKVIVKGEKSFLNCGTFFDFTKVNNGTGFYHDRSKEKYLIEDDKGNVHKNNEDCIIKDDNGNVINSGEIALNSSIGFIANVHIKNVDESYDHLRYDGLRGAGKKIIMRDSAPEGKVFDNGVADFNISGLVLGSDLIEVNGPDNIYVAYISIYTHIKWGLTNHGKRFLKAYNPQTGEELILHIPSSKRGDKIETNGKADFIIRKYMEALASRQRTYYGELGYTLNLDTNGEKIAHSTNPWTLAINTGIGAVEEDGFIDYAYRGKTLSSPNPDWTFVSYVSKNTDHKVIGTYIGNGNSKEIFDKKGNSLFTLAPFDENFPNANKKGCRYLYIATLEEQSCTSILIKSIDEEGDWIQFYYKNNTHSFIYLNKNSVDTSTSPIKSVNWANLDMKFDRAVNNNESNLQTQISLIDSYLHYPEGKDESGYITSKEKINELIPVSTFESLEDDTYYIYKEKGSSTYKAIKDIAIGSYKKENSEYYKIVFNRDDCKFYDTTPISIGMGENILIGGEFLSQADVDLWNSNANITWENNSLKITPNGFEYRDISRMISDFEVGKKYQIRFKTSNATTDWSFSISGSEQYFYARGISSLTQEYNYEFIAKEKDISITISLYNYEIGSTINFDEITIREIFQEPASNNLLINGDFKIDLNGWSNSTGRWTWLNGKAKLTTSNEYEPLIQNFQTIVGNKYRVSFDLSDVIGNIKAIIYSKNYPEDKIELFSSSGKCSFEFIAKESNTSLAFARAADGSSCSIENIFCVGINLPIKTPISFISKVKVASGTPQYLEELDIPTNIMDSLSVKSLMLGKSDIKESLFGIDQKWKNMTHDRDWDEKYTNTSGKTIIVAANIKSSNNGTSICFQGYVDGIKTFNIEHGGVSGTTGVNTCLMLVPNGSIYHMEKSNDEIIIEWSELR